MDDFKRLQKGPAWELRLHRALFMSGWYVRRNVDLRERIAGSPQVMAEVDLLGVSFDAGLSARRLVSECKDRKGSTQEADRVIWLLGLGRLLEADTLVFAKPRIAPATVQFSRSTDVALLEEAAVIHVERTLEGVRVAGAFDPDINEDLLAPAVARDVIGNMRLREAYDWIHNASWIEEPAARVKRLPAYFRLISGNAKGKTQQLLYIEGLLGLLACGLQTAGKLRRHSPQVARALGAESLVSGAASASALREIAATADDYYRDAFERAAEAAGGRRLMLDVPRLSEHIARPPRWADSFFSFAESVGARPEAATDVLRYAEITLFEEFAGRDPRPAQQTFVRGDHDWLAGTLLLAAAFCQRVWGLTDPFFDRRSAREPEGNGARAIQATAAAAAPADGGPTNPDGATLPEVGDENSETAASAGQQASLLDEDEASAPPPKRST